MAQTSTILSGAKSHISDITGTDISFTNSGNTNTISSSTTALTGSDKLAVRDRITVTNSTNNNSTFTVKAIVSTTEFTVEEIVTTENSDGSTTITIDHVGFVTDKAKGDGYYSQVDGVHTVMYKVVNLGDSSDDYFGTIKMQGSLATDPTEDDYFDISGTSFTSDQSTTIVSKNFTGNFVWVRAHITTTNNTSNPSLVTEILLNN